MPCAVRQNKGPSTSALTETEEETSHDESSTHEESEPEQEVYINHTHPHAPQPVYTNMVHYIIDSSNGNSNARIFWNVNSLPSLNAKSVRRLSHGLVTLKWINMYPGGYPRLT